MTQRGSGNSTSEYTICIDTVNRDSSLYPDTNDLVLNIDTAHLRRGAVQLYVGSFELPAPQFTIEEMWQNLWFDEGIRITDANLATAPIAAGATVIVSSSASVIYTAFLPLFTNPLASITVVSPTELSIVTQFNHALNLRSFWDPLNPIASRLPIKLIATGLFDSSEIDLTAANPNLTIVNATTFTLMVADTSGFGMPATVINNQGYVYAPAIDSPVALVTVLNAALAQVGFLEGSFFYDLTTSSFSFRTSFYGKIGQPTMNIRCPNGVQTPGLPPGVCFIEPVLSPGERSLLQCMGFLGSRICANTQLPSGQWYIPAETSQLWRGNISITPGFYGPQDLTQLGSEITTQFNRFYVDPATCAAMPSVERFLFSNAVGNCINFVVPPGGYTPTTLAAFLQASMNTADPQSFDNTGIIGSNIYSVTWILAGAPAAPNVGFFSFACSGVFGLEFGDSIGTSSMPSRLGFSNVAYRAGPEFSGKNITVSELGCGASNAYLHSYYIQLLANNGRRGYRIEPSLPRTVPTQTISAVTATTLTAGNAAFAHGFQVNDVITISFPATVGPIFSLYTVVTAVIDAFSFTAALPVGTTPALANGDVFAAQFAYDPSTFNIYFPQSRSFNGIYPQIIGFDYLDLMAPAPFTSTTTVQLEPPPYLLLQILDVKSSAYIQHNYLGDNITNILAKLIFYPTYQMQRLYPMSLSFNGSEIITQLHFRWLTPNHQLYQFHNRNWSGTLQLVVLGESPALGCA